MRKCLVHPFFILCFGRILFVGPSVCEEILTIDAAFALLDVYMQGACGSVGGQ